MLLALLLFAARAAPLSPGQLQALQSDRNVGLAALEEGNLAEAARRFERVRQTAPSDPLGWANGAVAAIRAKDLAAAEKLLAEALKLSPSDPRLAALDGVRRELAGDRRGAEDAYGRAVSAAAGDLPSRWAQARLASARGAEGQRVAAAEVDAALAQAPNNLFLLVRRAELARELNDATAAASARDRLTRLSVGDARLERALSEAAAADLAGDTKAADLKYRIVENILRTTPRYQQARRDAEPQFVGLPLEEWSPELEAAMRGRAGRPVPVKFAPVAGGGLEGVESALVVRAAGASGRDLLFAGTSGLRIAAASGTAYRLAEAISGSAATDAAVADVLNSGSLDVATPGALWISDASGFRKTSIAGGERIIPFDVDADGDLDLYVAGPAGDHLLRNNLDGTFTDVTEAAGLPKGVASRAAVAADFDRDGDIDLLVAPAGGGFALYDNLRGGRLARRDAGLPGRGNIQAATAGDLDGDGRLDLVWAGDGGAFFALNRGDGTFLEPKPLGRGDSPLLFDYDNDGFLDVLLVSATEASALWRNAGEGRFEPAGSGGLPAGVAAEAVDFDGDGDLDLVFVTPRGSAVLLSNDGGNANGWIDVALEGLPTGSAKVNRFGYGSEVEARSGDLYVYRIASRPVTRLGLGDRRRADVLRVVWTNGVPQNALDPRVRAVLREVQQLKGSCPFLYAFDGGQWRFVTDVLGRSPAGLLYDGVHQAAADTREWLEVPGRLLQPVGGSLMLDLTEELWETAYIDRAELRAVDHPAGVEIVPNERMVPPPFPDKSLFTVARPSTPRARDEAGRDRTAEIASEDGVFLGGFAPTSYQGIVAPHVLELELPAARGARTVMLYLTGWIQYADTSINVSLSQRRDLAAEGPVLEVPDGRGGWRTAIAPMGYPAGKTKTMPIDLSAVLDPADPRVRIRTNLAIYWDRIVYTVDELPAPLRIVSAPLVSAELSERGFSRMMRASDESPHVFVHEDVTTEPRWADMAGWYTRLGDVRPLLSAVDDRYVVMKGGDAVRLTFDASALPPVPEGWVRDWLFVADGWDKDGDKNTVAGQTVEPLPFHGMDDGRYGEIDFPDGEEHRAFVREWLTRWGGPEEFRDAVRKSVSGQQ